MRDIIILYFWYLKLIFVTYNYKHLYTHKHKNQILLLGSTTFLVTALLGELWEAFNSVHCTSQSNR